MMKFNKIVLVDNTGLIDEAKENLKNYANEVVYFEASTKDDNKIIEKIGDAECLLVSWDTVISKKVIESCNNLKYIGLCCSLYGDESSNVELRVAREHGIKFLGVNDYGDNGVIEYIIYELVKLLHGFGEHQWKDVEREITYQKIGIIGLGATGIILARALSLFGAEVYYYSRTRKLDIENEINIKYLDLDELLETVDIISTHLPKNSAILNEEKFNKFGNNKILINTSIGATFVVEDLKKWLENKNNYLICDSVAFGEYEEEIKKTDNIIYTNKPAARTYETNMRLSKKVIENIETFLSGNCK